RKFLAQRMEVGPLRITTVTTNGYGAVESSSSVDIWTVYQGQNTIVTGRNFADVMKDGDTQSKMQSQRTVGAAIGAPLALGGLAVVAYGTYAFIEHPLKDSSLGLFLGGTLGGGLASGIGFAVWMSPGARQNWVSNYYTEDKANELVDQYN